MISLERLRQVPILNDIPDKELERLSENMGDIQAIDGQIIFEEGSAGESVYFVASGEVVIKKSVDKTNSTFRVITVLEPGEIFGEMALLEDTHRSATAVAKGKVTLFKLDRHNILRLVLADPARGMMSAFLTLLTTLSSRLRHTTQQLATVYDVVQLVATVDSFKIKTQKALDRVMDVLAPGLGGATYIWSRQNEEYIRTSSRGGITVAWPISVAPTETFPRKLEGEMVAKIFTAIDPKFWLDTLKKHMWEPVSSLLLAPLVGSRQPLAGFMVIIDPEKSDRFTSSDRQLLMAVAQLLAVPFEMAAGRDEDIALAREARVKTNLKGLLSDGLV